MNFIDLKTQYAGIEADVDRRIKQVLQHGQYIMGPEVQELEQRLADFVGVKHCVGVSSGTDALLIAMMALDIGAGDEVITTPFTFIATGEMIALLGATPVFVDIDPLTYNIDPAKIEAAVTPRTKAIMPVALYGQCADMDAINVVAEKHGVAVIEDAAQSFGATYKGRQSCGLSEIGCTSFFPSKPLGGYGDAGACFTNDDELAKVMQEIRNHGQDRRYHHPRVGLNGRIDTLQAAILLAKMEIFPQEVEDRAAIGARYCAALQQRGAVEVSASGGAMQTPKVAENNTSVFAQFTVQVEDRETFTASMQEAGIPTAVHYPVPLNEQPAMLKSTAGKLDETPICQAVAHRVVSLPMHPYMSEDDINKVADAAAAAAGLSAG